VHVEAVANAIKQAQKQEDDARKAGQLGAGRPLLRIAVWHHAVAGPEQMKNAESLGHLQNNGVRLALHGDVHEMRDEVVGYRHKKSVHVVGSRRPLVYRWPDPDGGKGRVAYYDIKW
jgi:hypothetical protein